jgi:predicted enzyme related to lactoylglutathione lyase
MRNPSGDGELAGIMDADGFLPEGTPSYWSVYFEVDDIDAVAERAQDLGGAVVTPPRDTPYGRLATLADTAGARFSLRSVKR